MVSLDHNELIHVQPTQFKYFEGFMRQHNLETNFSLMMIQSNFYWTNKEIRYVDGTPTSEVTPVTTQYIHPPHHGYPRSQSWSWMVDSQPFLSMSISTPTPIPQIRLFQTLTFKLQGQGHGCGQRARPYSHPVSKWFAFFCFTLIR